MSLNYVSEARETAGQGSILPGDLIDERVLIDIAGEFNLTDAVALFGTVTNLADEVYTVSFSPAGARPASPWAG